MLAATFASAPPATAAEAGCRPGQVRWLERWDTGYAAVARRPVAVYARPGGPVVARLGLRNARGSRTAFALVAERVDRTCVARWYRVRAPLRPTRVTRWVRAADVRRYRVDRRIVVDLSSNRLYLYRRGKLVHRATVATGTSGTPTPVGRFYVTDRFVLRRPTGPYGSRAIGLSAFSDVLRTWTQGGPVAIHGTNRPGLVGSRVSHGCVRMTNAAVERLFPHALLGVPVTVRR